MWLPFHQQIISPITYSHTNFFSPFQTIAQKYFFQPYPLDVSSISPSDYRSHHIFTLSQTVSCPKNCLLAKNLGVRLPAYPSHHIFTANFFSPFQTIAQKYFYYPLDVSSIHTFTHKKLSSWSEIASLSFSSHIHRINQPRHQSHHIFTKVITALNSIILFKFSMPLYKLLLVCW